MKKYYSFIISLLSLLLLSSCSKKADPFSLNYSAKEDPNNFFTATFNGKTLKTSGFIFTSNGIVDESGSITVANAQILTSNNGSSIVTSVTLAVTGSTSNIALMDKYKIPAQHLDASIIITRLGNALGTYKLEDYGVGYVISSITDLTVGGKKYDLDLATTSFTITLADAKYIQGSYTGRLIDGNTKIPVTGNFKFKKF